ncbi:MAG: BatD family protein [Bacteroidota bacterium]
MKQLMVSFVFCAGLFSVLTAQKEPKFTLEVSSDSILFGNYFLATFTLENAQSYEFQAPEFEGFEIVSGPNQSTSYSMMNDEVSQKIAYSYYLRPIELGIYYIQPGGIMVEGQLYETLPTEIMVVPNPEGKIVNPHPKTPAFGMGLDGFSPFNIPNDFFDIGDNMFRMPDLTPIKPKKETELEKKKKKKKIYKM